jgi:hypothetical protein
MYSSFNKPKPKIHPMNLDFDFMIKNHPEFFTKLSSQNFEYPPLSPLPDLPLLRLGVILGWLTRVSPLEGWRAVARLSEEGSEARRDIKTKNISANTHEKCKN